jgi:hypothetical protein
MEKTMAMKEHEAALSHEQWSAIEQAIPLLTADIRSQGYGDDCEKKRECLRHCLLALSVHRLVMNDCGVDVDTPASERFPDAFKAARLA